MREALNFVLVDNDRFWMHSASQDLQETFPGSRVVSLEAESQLEDQLPNFRQNPPDVFVLGLWVRRRLPPEDDNAGKHFMEAGLRMVSGLGQDPHTAEVPVIICDTFGKDYMKSSFPEGGRMHFVDRTRSDNSALISTIRELIDQ